jgi:DNA repair photolyase
MADQPSSGRAIVKGRGAASNPDNRFSEFSREDFDDDWPGDGDAPPPLRTTLHTDRARSVITRNDSPDIPFDRSVNPYRGCEHGCIYCFARPSHAYLGHSPGLEFETEIYHKPEGAERLADELRGRGYRPEPLALGVNTDAWQPVERRAGVTRSLLEVLWAFRHPVSLITKSAGIVRDLDLLAPMAEAGLVSAVFSITTLDPELSRRMEPRAARPAARLRAMRRLHEAGVPVGVSVAPIVPGLTDPEIESILDAAHQHGATWSRYILLRLPHELGALFRDWLNHHYPERAGRVMARVRDTQGGKDYDPRFGVRMRGTGPVADLIARRFELASGKLGLAAEGPELDRSQFKPPPRSGDQMDLF